MFTMFLCFLSNSSMFKLAILLLLCITVNCQSILDDYEDPNLSTWDPYELSTSFSPYSFWHALHSLFSPFTILQPVTIHSYNTIVSLPPISNFTASFFPPTVFNSTLP